MLSAALSSIADADAVMWIVEPTDYIGKGEQYIIEELKKSNLPVILAMNKTDTVTKEELIKHVETYSKVLDFAEIVPVSAMTGDNVGVLLEQLFKYMPYGPMFFDEDTLTDQPVKQIAAEIIREKALQLLSDEVPHGIAVVVDKFRERTKADGSSLVDIEASIICERESHKGIIIGKGGEMLKKIGSAARYEIERLVDSKIALKLWVKVKKDWRDSDTQLKNFGYDNKRL